MHSDHYLTVMDWPAGFNIKMNVTIMSQKIMKQEWLKQDPNT